MRSVIPVLALALPACTASGVLGGPIDSIDDLREACDEGTPEDVELNVSFNGLDGGCDFGSKDNLPADQGVLTARREQIVSLNLPAGGVACDLDFDFAGIDPSLQQSVTYDDHFFLTFAGVVLAASSAPLVDVLPDDEGLRFWDWPAIVGTPFDFDGVPTYCLGEEEGVSDCTLPPPDTPGPLSLSFGGDLVDRLSLNAIEQDNFNFGFIVTGDNDNSDCSMEPFDFTVVAPVVFP